MAQLDALMGMRTAAVRKVELDRPWRWLEAGWKDLSADPVPSVIYGIIFAATGWFVTWGLFWFGWPYLILPLAGGFLLIAPLLATGLYELSRARAAGEPTSFVASLQAYSRNPTQVGLMGVALLIGFIAWADIALILFMMWFGLEPPQFSDLFAATFLDVRNLGFTIIGTLIGGMFALVIFTMTVVSVPMLIAQPKSNIAAAMTASYKAVRANPAPMALWAGLIVVFTGAGIALLYIGLIVTMPLIAHASWHAYEDLVEPKEGS
ncbi:MAG: DUF2189 domain-containing protein [Pseudomonadota bacterium]